MLGVEEFSQGQVTDAYNRVKFTESNGPMTSLLRAIRMRSSSPKKPGDNDRHVLVVPVFTENLNDSASRLALPKEVLGRRAVAHADKLTRLAITNLKAIENGPVGSIEEEDFFDLNLAIGKAIGAHFFRGIRGRLETAGEQTTGSRHHLASGLARLEAGHFARPRHVRRVRPE